MRTVCIKRGSGEGVAAPGLQPAAALLCAAQLGGGAEACQNPQGGRGGKSTAFGSC